MTSSITENPSWDECFTRQRSRLSGGVTQGRTGATGTLGKLVQEANRDAGNRADAIQQQPQQWLGTVAGGSNEESG